MTMPELEDFETLAVCLQDASSPAERLAGPGRSVSVEIKAALAQLRDVTKVLQAEYQRMYARDRALAGDAAGVLLVPVV